jgi:hypothetical protein
MGSLLKFASAETTRLDLGDGDWLDVRSDVSKRDFNNLIKKMPQDIDPSGKVTMGQATDLGVALFDTLVTGWSFEGEDATVDNYLRLNRAAADVIDSKLGEHFSSLTPTKEEQTKSKRGS